MDIGIVVIKGLVSMKSKRCSKCAQHAKLRQTGNSPDKAQLYCPICKKEYYLDKEGNLSTERPAEWPAKKPESENYEIKKGHWQKV